jgi:carbon storage regulator
VVFKGGILVPSFLCLSRKLGESVIIGTPPNAIRVTVAHIDKGKIRLLFDAPRDVPIWREEIVHEREAAAAAGPVNGS